MRTVFEEEEEEIAAHALPREHQPDRELTISSTTLLAIFFGLVLLCGLFFGLGYSLGRRSPGDAGQLPAATPAAQPYGSQSKPSAAAQTALPATTASQPTETAVATPTPSQEDSVSPEPETKVETPAAQIVKPVSLPKTQIPAAAAVLAIPAAATPPGAFMVQIAAVSNPADADVLVSALQKRGYSVSARHTPADTFIHVQVGPFANRADAVAMRQKLLSDGYNAILKP